MNHSPAEDQALQPAEATAVATTAPQFSMAALMLVVTIAAVLVAVLRLIGPQGEPLVMFIVGSLPTMIVWTVGIALAIRRWPLHPAASLCTLVAMALLMGLRVLGGIIPQLLIDLARSQSIAPQDVLSIYTFLSSCVAAVAFSLLLVAIFGRRA